MINARVLVSKQTPLVTVLVLNEMVLVLVIESFLRSRTSTVIRLSTSTTTKHQTKATKSGEY